jgi:hypothetical protein
MFALNTWPIKTEKFQHETAAKAQETLLMGIVEALPIQ